MTALHIRGTGRNLAAWSLFAAMISAAGLPIYIHAPKFYVDRYGVSLAALGSALFILRLFDVVQDPVLGWFSEKTRRHRARMVPCAAVLMVTAMYGLFCVHPPVSPILWFSTMLALLFSSFSFLSISFYAEGVAKAGSIGTGGHLHLAGWREAGGLLGVSAAAVAPVLLAKASDAPFEIFVAGFAVLTLVATLAMRPEWSSASGGSHVPLQSTLSDILRDKPARALLLLALVNATPVAVTSTLFLFYVESRLGAPASAGVMLLLFFMAAAASTPLWSALAARFGERTALLIGMLLAVVSFGYTARLGTGDVGAFAVICVASGAALGADLTILPALFARRLSIISPGAGMGFGIWAFVNKFALAFTAIALLPLLQANGFVPGGQNSEQALSLLSTLYAVLPCLLKIVAIALLIVTPAATGH